jgi:hypothetical protein
MVLLVLPPPDHHWIGTKSRQFLPSRRLTNTRARRAAEILALGPSCRPQRRSSNAKSLCGQNFGCIPGNLRDISKGYFAMTFLSSNPTSSAMQSGLWPETRFKLSRDRFASFATHLLPGAPAAASLGLRADCRTPSSPACLHRGKCLWPRGCSMANDEHVAILKKGVDAWNAWREPRAGPPCSGSPRRGSLLAGPPR